MKIVWATLALCAATLGCDRTHMSPSYGKTVRQAFNAQVDLTASARTSGGAHGLEPEEAAIVLESYRKSLSREKQDSAGNRAPVLSLPPQQPGQPYPPPYQGQ